MSEKKIAESKIAESKIAESKITETKIAEKKIAEKKITDRIKKNSFGTCRPSFPKRAVITAGMPYGNKDLHFGHIGGVFIHADVFARFLRDRIGKDNVIFVSGTDCYGSPIMEGYRKLNEEGSFKGTIEDYVKENHDKQKEALNLYEISLNLYGASALGNAGKLHAEVSEEIFNKLYDKGCLEKLSTPQFYDPVYKVLLNGRQVTGQCPIEGCTSERGYADECSLGHQYMPSELINPISTLSGVKPEVCEVTNWYFKLEEFMELLKKRNEYLWTETNTRRYLLSAIEEFLKKPVIYVKKSQLIPAYRERTGLQKAADIVENDAVADNIDKDAAVDNVEKDVAADNIEKDVAVDNVEKDAAADNDKDKEGELNIADYGKVGILAEIKRSVPDFEYYDSENKSSVTLVFNNLKDRDMARGILSDNGITCRTGKTLVPFRLSGNIKWGVKVPDKDGLKDLTFWVWPESLWAPISFTKAYLEDTGGDWRKWWCSMDAEVYQFIGEDNIYFYGIAEMAMFMALKEQEPKIQPKEGELTLPHLIANNHVLFMDRKASSSGAVKPPMAKELLKYYTAEQLRMHFLSFGLDTKSVSFQPKVYMEGKEDVPDPVLKEGNLLTNVFNRLVRSCFYTSQKYYASKIPDTTVSEAIIKTSEEAVLEYERHMYNHEFHRITYVLDTYIRNMNKYWVNNIRIADTEDNDVLRKQILIDTLHAVRTAVTLLHPIAPSGCDMVREYLGVSEELWNWEKIFEPLNTFITDKDKHCLKFLEPRVDFFKKHESQLGTDN